MLWTNVRTQDFIWSKTGAELESLRMDVVLSGLYFKRAPLVPSSVVF